MRAGLDLNIEATRSHHLQEITSLAGSFRLDRSSPGQAPERGFLVSNYTEEDYRGFLRRADYFFAIMQRDEVAGYILAYSSDRIQANEWLNTHIKELYPEPFILIKQICTRRDFTSKGLATRLYHHLFKLSKGQAIFAAVVMNPPNSRSVRFHEKLGFKKVLEMRPPDGILRGIWKRESATGKGKGRRKNGSSRRDTEVEES